MWMRHFTSSFKAWSASKSQTKRSRKGASKEESTNNLKLGRMKSLTRKFKRPSRTFTNHTEKRSEKNSKNHD